MEKYYFLIHLDFRDKTYQVHEYVKDRRYTANQAWKHIKSQRANYKEGVIPLNSTIEFYTKIIEELGLDQKNCDRYVTLNPIR